MRWCLRLNMSDWVTLASDGEELEASHVRPAATRSSSTTLPADRWKRFVVRVVGIRRIQEHFYAVGVHLQEFQHDWLLCISHQYGYRLEEKRENDGRANPPGSMKGGPRRAPGERARLEAERRR